MRIHRSFCKGVSTCLGVVPKCILVNILLLNISNDFSEWLSNQNRDSLASYIGHHSLLAYMAIAEGNAIGRERYKILEVYQFNLFAEIIRKCQGLADLHHQQ